MKILNLLTTLPGQENGLQPASIKGSDIDDSLTEISSITLYLILTTEERPELATFNRRQVQMLSIYIKISHMKLISSGISIGSGLLYQSGTALNSVGP